MKKYIITIFALSLLGLSVNAHQPTKHHKTAYQKQLAIKKVIRKAQHQQRRHESAVNRILRYVYPPSYPSCPFGGSCGN